MTGCSFTDFFEEFWWYNPITLATTVIGTKRIQYITLGQIHLIVCLKAAARISFIVRVSFSKIPRNDFFFLFYFFFVKIRKNRSQNSNSECVPEFFAMALSDYTTVHTLLVTLPRWTNSWYWRCRSLAFLSGWFLHQTKSNNSLQDSLTEIFSGNNPCITELTRNEVSPSDFECNTDVVHIMDSVKFTALALS